VRKPFLLTLIALLLLLVGELHYFLKPQPTEKELQQLSGALTAGTQWQGKYAPAFDLTTIQGEHFSLSDSVGKKVIVLNFFATWCEPCQSEMAEFERYFEEHKDGSFVLLAVDARETPEQVAAFFQEHKLRFPVGIDDGRVEKLYRVTGYPTTVLIGVDGRIQFYEVGALPNANVALDGFLRANSRMLAAGKAISKTDYLEQTGLPPPPPPKNEAPKGRLKRIRIRVNSP
jgi:peroxiredoxin